MQLTEEERTALERYRSRHQHRLYPGYLGGDLATLACVVDRLFPVRTYGDIPIPRNMGEVWQLMERCGIEEGK